MIESTRKISSSIIHKAWQGGDSIKVHCQATEKNHLPGVDNVRHWYRGACMSQN